MLLIFLNAVLVLNSIKISTKHIQLVFDLLPQTSYEFVLLSILYSTKINEKAHLKKLIQMLRTKEETPLSKVAIQIIIENSELLDLEQINSLIEITETCSSQDYKMSLFRNFIGTISRKSEQLDEKSVKKLLDLAQKAYEYDKKKFDAEFPYIYDLPRVYVQHKSDFLKNGIKQLLNEIGVRYTFAWSLFEAFSYSQLLEIYKESNHSSLPEYIILRFIQGGSFLKIDLENLRVSFIENDTVVATNLPREKIRVLEYYSRKNTFLSTYRATYTKTNYSTGDYYWLFKKIIKDYIIFIVHWTNQHFFAFINYIKNFSSK